MSQMPTDDELARLLWESKVRRTAERGRFDQGSDTPFDELDRRVVRDLVDEVRAVKEAVLAAQPVPVIPEWAEEVVVCVMGDPMDDDYGSYQREVEGSGATLTEALEALQAAIDQIGGESHG